MAKRKPEKHAPKTKQVLRSSVVSDDDSFAFLQSLAGKIVEVQLLLPPRVVELLRMAREGDQVAITLLTIMETVLDSAPGLLCIACDAVLGQGDTGAVMLFRDQERPLLVASLPICWPCTMRPDVRQRVQEGVRRNVFGECRFINANMHAAGHA